MGKSSLWHVLCRHDSAAQTETKETVRSDTREVELKLLAGQYRLGVETQMHFNQLIIRTRTLGMYGVVLVMGSAFLLRSQYPNAAPFHLDIPAANLALQLSAPAVISLFGPVLLVIVYLMAQALLPAPSLRDQQLRVFDRARHSREQPDPSRESRNTFRQGLFIQEAFGHRAGASVKFVKACYAMVALAELIVIVLLVTNP